jgi:hypothetical protein
MRNALETLELSGKTNLGELPEFVRSAFFGGNPPLDFITLFAPSRVG